MRDSIQIKPDTQMTWELEKSPTSTTNRATWWHVEYQWNNKLRPSTFQEQFQDLEDWHAISTNTPSEIL